MDAKKAMQIIKEGSHEWEDFYAALSVAVKALEKQIPKKAIKDGLPACPNCKTIFIFRTNETKGQHCKYCGQAIEWEGDV